MESRERLDDLRKWRTRRRRHNGNGVPASFPGFGTSVTKFVVWKEEDKGWLVETRVIYCFFNTKLHRLRTLRLVCSSTLRVVSDFTLCVRSGYPLSPVHAPESPLRLSQCSPLLNHAPLATSVISITMETNPVFSNNITKGQHV